MARCFVIQPFDNGEFDRRFDEVISPAIKSADLEPYRVDRDPNTTILYKDIQAGIENAAVCLADITTDNPNVWFELGYALARRKQVVLICAKSRTKFPFDIQHRSIIPYNTTSPSDFDEMRTDILKKLKAALKRSTDNTTIEQMSAIKATDGLSPHEITALVTMGSESILDEEGVSGYQLANAMENTGYTKIAAKLSLVSLQKRGMVEKGESRDPRSDESYLVYRLSDQGLQWLLDNQDQIELKRETPNAPPGAGPVPF